MKWYQTWRWEAPPWEHHQGADTLTHRPLATVLVTVTWSPDLLISWPLSWSQWPTWDMWRSMAWSLTSDWSRVVTWPGYWPLIGPECSQQPPTLRRVRPPDLLTTWCHRWQGIQLMNLQCSLSVTVCASVSWKTSHLSIATGSDSLAGTLVPW